MRVRVAGRRGSPGQREVVRTRPGMDDQIVAWTEEARMPEQEVNTEMEQPPVHTFDTVYKKPSKLYLSVIAFKLDCAG